MLPGVIYKNGTTLNDHPLHAWACCHEHHSHELQTWKQHLQKNHDIFHDIEHTGDVKSYITQCEKEIQKYM